MSTPLTKSRILMGIKFEKTITVRAYGNASVKIHPLSDAVLTKIQADLGYGMFDAMRDLSQMGLKKEQIGDLMENNDSALEMITDLKLPANLLKYVTELCRLGIVPEPDPDCPKCHGKPGKDICPECDIRSEVDNFVGFSTLEIGTAVLGISAGNWQEVEDFFKAKKAESGAEQSP
jgi:hypothetical protein